MKHNTTGNFKIYITFFKIYIALFKIFITFFKIYITVSPFRGISPWISISNFPRIHDTHRKHPTSHATPRHRQRNAGNKHARQKGDGRKQSHRREHVSSRNSRLLHLFFIVGFRTSNQKEKDQLKRSPFIALSTYVLMWSKYRWNSR